jgi:hypothetical protein
MVLSSKCSSGNPLDELPLEDGVHNYDWKEGNRSACHKQWKVCNVASLEVVEASRERPLAIHLDQDHRE